MGRQRRRWVRTTGSSNRRSNSFVDVGRRFGREQRTHTRCRYARHVSRSHSRPQARTEDSFPFLLARTIKIPFRSSLHLSVPRAKPSKILQGRFAIPASTDQDGHEIDRVSFAAVVEGSPKSRRERQRQ